MYSGALGRARKRELESIARRSSFGDESGTFNGRSVALERIVARKASYKLVL